MKAAIAGVRIPEAAGVHPSMAAIRVNAPEIFLGAGELAFATGPAVVKTLLGSCVGVALYDPEKRLGGMCHFLLPDGPDYERSTRFGRVAIRALISKFLSRGSDPRRLKAWMAGGAMILESSAVFFVGERNIAVADEMLAAVGISPLARDVGGDRGRKMRLDTFSGKASIEYIPRTDLSGAALA